MTLHDKQVRFAHLLAYLLLRAEELGYQVTMGECWRSPEEAARHGHPHSNHCLRLAVDLNLFRDGAFLTTTEAHRPLGTWWESQDPWCRWGGRFLPPLEADGNHYSMEHEGRS